MSNQAMTAKELHQAWRKPKRTIRDAIAHKLAAQEGANAADTAGTGAFFRVTLPIPPSANRYWRNFRGRMVVSAEAQAYKAAAAISAKDQGAWLICGDVAIQVDFYRARKAGDLDNRLKVILDSLNGIAYEDDNQITEIHARRFDDKGNGRVEITVTKL